MLMLLLGNIFYCGLIEPIFSIKIYGSKCDLFISNSTVWSSLNEIAQFENISEIKI